MMVDHKLKGVFGVRDKSSTYGLSRSLAMEEKHITDLEILTYHLQQRLRLYEDFISIENLMEGIGKYKIEEKYELYEESFNLVNFKVSWGYGTRRLKVCAHETMIIMRGMDANIRMKITIRGMVTMMKT